MKQLEFITGTLLVFLTTFVTIPYLLAYLTYCVVSICLTLMGKTCWEKLEIIVCLTASWKPPLFVFTNQIHTSHFNFVDFEEKDFMLSEPEHIFVVRTIT